MVQFHKEINVLFVFKIFKQSVIKTSLNVESFKFLKVSHYLNVIVDIDLNVPFLHIKEEVEVMLPQDSEHKWWQNVNRAEGENGQDQNKLRSNIYRTFKQDIYMYWTLGLIRKKRYRKALAIFRTGVAPINIDIKRYGTVKLPVENRRCILCVLR